MAEKLDWNTVWEQFEDWAQGEEQRLRCCECGNTHAVDWEEQKDKIQALVEAQLQQQRAA